MTNNKKKNETLPSFENALQELEKMVNAMESGELPLEELISTYEHGAKLISHCESMLNGARKRLDIIQVKSTSLEPSTDKPSVNSEEIPSDTSNDDEPSLL